MRLPPVTPAGYTLEWNSKDSAADGAGYISAYISSVVEYNAAVTDCAASCTSNTECAFFNTYTEASDVPAEKICVLWDLDKPLSSAFNSYNNGRPISDSNGYVKSANSISPSTS